MMLQPLLENAITHGMIEGETLNILLDVSVSDGKLHIIVSDDGMALDEEELRLLNDSGDPALSKSRSIGIRNIRDRLRIFSKGGSVLCVSSDGARGVTVTIELPL